MFYVPCPSIAVAAATCCCCESREPTENEPITRGSYGKCWETEKNDS